MLRLVTAMFIVHHHIGHVYYYSTYAIHYSARIECYHKHIKDLIVNKPLYKTLLDDNLRHSNSMVLG